MSVKQLVYTRRLSRDEAEQNYVLVLKDKLSFFPPIGKLFDLAFKDKSYRVRVEAEPCTCRAPDKPHEHYYISLGPFGEFLKVREKDEVTFTKTPQRYILTV